MTLAHASKAWCEARKLGLNAVARYMTAGPLEGEHVVEIEPGHDIGPETFGDLMEIGHRFEAELSYGRSPRRVLVLA